MFYNFQYNLFNFYGERTRESRRDRWLNYYCPRIFAVLGVAYNSFSNEKEKKASTLTNGSFSETLERGSRFNERNSTGRFANTKSKVKSLIPLHAGCRSWQAKRKLVFDEPDEDEPPTKCQTRSEKVKTENQVDCYSYTQVHNFAQKDL